MTHSKQQIKERPIPFTGEMVRAILDGRKTQTRRAVKPQPDFMESSGRWIWPIPKRAQVKGCSTECVTASREWWEYMPGNCCPYGQPGDRLWVREIFAPNYYDGGGCAYKADYSPITEEFCPEPKWKPSIHMPRAASRILLEITDVRVERLNEISEEDAIAEGCKCFVYEQPYFNTGNDYSPGEFGPPSDHFVELWKSIHGLESWDQNPWVWVVEFKRL